MASNNSHRSGDGRDGIAIAFTQSQYPTPYTDQTIPGSSPGHRLRHLGRQHQPDDVLYNHLSHALVAHGDSSGATAEPWEGNADHPSPPGGNYVLHTKNGGKRHYDEPCGQQSEQPWQPSKRIIAPLQEDERESAPQRRGRGVYNTDDGFIHPDAEAAAQQRAMAEQRQRERGGKARVSGPRNHTLAELGMMQHPDPPTQPTAGSSAGPVNASAVSSSPRAAAVADCCGTTQQKNDAEAKANASTRAAALAEDAAANGAYNGRTLLPSAGAGVPPQRGTAAEADAVSDYHRDQRMRCALHLRKAASSATATRAVDVQSVRELPNW